MANNNGTNAPPLFNNNKSLYGSRIQTNQSSKKISIIEDKTTLEPARFAPTSPNVPQANGHAGLQRGASWSSTDPSSSYVHKQVQIQKQALDALNLEQMHQTVHQQLDGWKNAMYNRVQSMKTRMLEENAQSYDQLVTFQNFMRKLLEEQLIQQLLLMKSNPQSVNPDELDEIERRLEQMNEEIELMKKFDLRLDSTAVQLVGDLQLHKMTDFSKHQPLPQPPRSPSPPVEPLPVVPERVVDEAAAAPASFESKPTPPVWTDATRQGLNSRSCHLAFRLLIPNNVCDELIGNFDIEQFHSMLELSCQSPIESILTIVNQDDLDASIDILSDLMVAFKCSPTQYELRLLYPKKFIPIITGKRNERLDRLRDKYQLDMVKVFPQTCPKSDERVVLLRSEQNEYIIYCLREIIQNVLEQGHFEDEDDDQSYVLYDPSENYDESIAHEYGGYKSNDLAEIVSISNANVASSEDLTESKQRASASVFSSSSSSLSKPRTYSDDAPLIYDETEPDSDENDDELERSRSSDDKRIFVKKLNSVKGRQVGLLIGPFGQHITQIREQTGAKIHLTNDDNEPSVIKGTKSQIHQALRLIRECLQTQKPIPRTAFKGGRRR